MNQIQMIKTFLSKGNNPKNIAMSIIQSTLGNNQDMNQLLQMANAGDSKGLEDYARKFCESRNIDFDKEFSTFINNIR